jgi:hypothetical protein
MRDHTIILLLQAREYVGKIILCASTAKANNATAAASEKVHPRTESLQNIRDNYIENSATGTPYVITMIV